MDLPVGSELTLAEVLGLSLTVLGIVITIVIYRRTRASDRQLAQETGAFRFSRIELSLLGLPIIEQGRSPSNWVLVQPGPTKRTGIYPLKFEVQNVGDGEAGQTVLQVVTAGHWLLPEEAGAKFETTPRAYGDLVRYSLDELEGNKRAVTAIIHTIPPKTKFSFTLPLILPPSINIPLSVEAVTRDDALVRVGLRYSYSYLLTVRVTTTRHGPNSFRLKLGVIGANDIKTAVLTAYQGGYFGETDTSNAHKYIGSLIRVFTHTHREEATNFVQFDIERSFKSEERIYYYMKPLPFRGRKAVFFNVGEDLNNVDLDVGSPGTVLTVLSIQSVPKRPGSEANDSPKIL